MVSTVNCVWRNRLGNNWTSTNNTVFADCDIFQNNSPLSNLYIVINPNILSRSPRACLLWYQWYISQQLSNRWSPRIITPCPITTHGCQHEYLKQMPLKRYLSDHNIVTNIDMFWQQIAVTDNAYIFTSSGKIRLGLFQRIILRCAFHSQECFRRQSFYHIYLFNFIFIFSVKFKKSSSACSTEKSLIRPPSNNAHKLKITSNNAGISQISFKVICAGSTALTHLSQIICLKSAWSWIK